MMGQHDRSEALFYYFRLEDQVPENHLLRLIDKHISFEFVRQQLKDSYSETGRPSIDPELLLRILLIGYLYGITSERKLVEELRMHLAWRWFTGLGFDQEIPHHSTFSKNRHRRFQESKLFEELFEQIVRQCMEVGLVQGKHLSVDGSFVEANAAKESRIPREQLAEAAMVNHTVRQFLVELEQQNPVEESVHEQDQVSTTDPDSTYATKGGTPARLGYRVTTCPIKGEPHVGQNGTTTNFRLTADGGLMFHCQSTGCVEYHFSDVLRMLEEKHGKYPGKLWMEEKPTMFAPTDSGNAERLIKRHGDNIRYVHDEENWRIWNGTNWAVDPDGEINRLALQAIQAEHREIFEMPDSLSRTKVLPFLLRCENLLLEKGCKC